MGCLSRGVISKLQFQGVGILRKLVISAEQNKHETCLMYIILNQGDPEPLGR